MIGPSSRTTSSIGPESARATSSARTMARVLGSTSTNTSTSTVITPVAMATPQAPGTDLGDELGGERRAQDVDHVVAEQHRADHGLLVGEQLVDPAGGAVAVALQLVHAPAAGAGQRGLGGGEHRRDRQQRQDDRRGGDQRGREVMGRLLRRSGSRATAAASTPLATNASPMPRGQDEGQRAALGLLVLRHVARPARRRRTGAPATSVQAGRQAGGGDGAAGALGVLAGAEAQRARRSGTPARSRRATASPCSSASPKPVSASSAWPKVWPRLSSARRPASRSSSATISAFISTERRDGVGQRRRVAAPAPPAPFASSHSKKATSPSRPYLITSA